MEGTTFVSQAFLFSRTETTEIFCGFGCDIFVDLHHNTAFHDRKYRAKFIKSFKMNDLTIRPAREGRTRLKLLADDEVRLPAARPDSVIGPVVIVEAVSEIDPQQAKGGHENAQPHSGRSF